MPKVINTANQARIKHLKPDQTTAIPGEHKLRVYRASPQDVMLQIWRDRTSVSLSLTFDEVKELASALINELPLSDLDDMGVRVEVMRININTEEMEALIMFHEGMRDDAIESCEKEEAEQRRERIIQLQAFLRRMAL